LGAGAVFKQDGYKFVIGRMQRQAARAGRRCGVDAEFEGEIKAAAYALRAFYRQRAAHERDQFAADRQTEACSAKAASGGSLCLAETFKNKIELVHCNADAGVLHREFDVAAFVLLLCQSHRNRDFTVLGELDRIAEQIQQDLTQAQGIANQAVW